MLQQSPFAYPAQVGFVDGVDAAGWYTIEAFICFVVGLALGAGLGIVYMRRKQVRAIS